MSRRPFFTEPLWQAIRAEQQGFSHGLRMGHRDLEPRPPTASIGRRRGLYVSGGFFQALGVSAQLGRAAQRCGRSEGLRRAWRGADHGFWQSRYGGNPTVIGQSIMLDNRPFTIVGVTPPDFSASRSDGRSTSCFRSAPKPLMRQDDVERASDLDAEEIRRGDADDREGTMSSNVCRSCWGCRHSVTATARATARRQACRIPSDRRPGRAPSPAAR